MMVRCLSFAACPVKSSDFQFSSELVLLSQEFNTFCISIFKLLLGFTADISFSAAAKQFATSFYWRYAVFGVVFCKDFF